MSLQLDVWRVGWRWRRYWRWWRATIGANQAIDLAAGGFEIPVAKFHQQRDACAVAFAGAATVAIIGTTALQIIKAETVFSATARAGTMLVAQEFPVDPKCIQDLRPATARPL